MKSASPVFRSRRFAVAALVLATLAGCATVAPVTSEQAVSVRAQQRWKALMAHDWKAVHQFLTPAFGSTMSAERYAYRFVGAPKWLDATVKSAKCEDDRCSVVVHIVVEYLPKGTKSETLGTDVTETWLREDGQWYKYEAM